MDRFIAMLSAQSRLPVSLRYALTLLLVAFGFLVGRTIDPIAPWLLMVATIFLSALIFDRGAGFLATAVGLGMLSSAQSGVSAVSLVLFFVVGAVIAIVVEALRSALSMGDEQELRQRVWYEQVVRRARNDLRMMTSVLEALRGTYQTEGQAFDAAIHRLRIVARARERLAIQGEDDERVELRPYLQAVGDALSALSTPPCKILLPPRGEPIFLRRSRAVAAAIVVNELVTNALRHTNSGPPVQSVAVGVGVKQGVVTLTMHGKGMGWPEEEHEGLGGSLAQAFATELQGAIVWGQTGSGCDTHLSFPLTA